MSCLSDIDLATLHQLRLNERVHYKLSWWNRPSIVQQRRKHEQQQQHQQQPQPKAKVQAEQRRTYGNRKTNKITNGNKNQCVEHVKNGSHLKFSAHQSRCESINSINAKSDKVFHQNCDGNATNVKCIAPESCGMSESEIRNPTTAKGDYNPNKLCCNGVANKSAISIDDDHFAILRRRRSGTWP